MSWAPLTITPPAGDADLIQGKATGIVQKRMVSPWQTGIGEGSGHYRHLSFPNAVNCLAKTIKNEQAAIGIAVTAANLTDFNLCLNSLNSAFPIREFCALEEQAKQLITLEIEKFNLPDSAGLIAQQVMDLATFPVIADLSKSAILQQANAAALSFDISNPLSNLTDFESLKSAGDTVIAGALDASKALISGGEGFRFYAESDIASALLSNVPNDSFTHTAIMLYTGSPAELALLSEIVC